MCLPSVRVKCIPILIGYDARRRATTNDRLVGEFFAVKNGQISLAANRIIMGHRAN